MWLSQNLLVIKLSISAGYVSDRLLTVQGRKGWWDNSYAIPNKSHRDISNACLWNRQQMLADVYLWIPFNFTCKHKPCHAVNIQLSANKPWCRLQASQFPVLIIPLILIFLKALKPPFPCSVSSLEGILSLWNVFAIWFFKTGHITLPCVYLAVLNTYTLHRSMSWFNLIRFEDYWYHVSLRFNRNGQGSEQAAKIGRASCRERV